jgi:hypothetical protein
MSEPKKEGDPRIERRIRAACALALLALGMIVWSLLHPKPLPVIVAMSVGQVVGTLSLGLFLYAVVADLRRALSARKTKDE